MIDYHVHLWPHQERAESSELRLERLASYCEHARAHGVEEIALTEHLFRFSAAHEIADRFWDEESDPTIASSMERYFAHHATADLDEYVEAVLEARRAGLPVVLGLEVDYYPGRMDHVARLLAGYPFDVLLGSIHWLGSWLFDNLDDARARAEWDRRSAEEVWRAYTESLEELAATKTCDVLAHPDVVKLIGVYPSEATLNECHDRIAEAAARAGHAAEISSAGFRKPVGSAYPDDGLLRRFFARGVPVTMASDSHGPSNVADRSAELAELARGAGYGSLRAFRGRQGIDLPIERQPGETLVLPDGPDHGSNHPHALHR